MNIGDEFTFETNRGHQIDFINSQDGDKVMNLNYLKTINALILTGLMMASGAALAQTQNPAQFCIQFNSKASKSNCNGVNCEIVREAAMTRNPELLICLAAKPEAVSKTIGVSPKEAQTFINKVRAEALKVLNIDYSQIMLQGRCYEKPPTLDPHFYSGTAADSRSLTGADSEASATELRQEVAKIDPSLAEKDFRDMVKYEDLKNAFYSMSAPIAYTTRFSTQAKYMYGKNEGFTPNDMKNFKSEIVDAITKATKSYRMELGEAEKANVQMKSKAQEIMKSTNQHIDLMNAAYRKCLLILAHKTKPNVKTYLTDFRAFSDTDLVGCYQDFLNLKGAFLTDSQTGLAMSSEDLFNQLGMQREGKDLGVIETRSDAPPKVEFIGYKHVREVDILKAISQLQDNTRFLGRNLPIDDPRVYGSAGYQSARYIQDLDRSLALSPSVTLKMIADHPNLAPLICERLQTVKDRKKQEAADVRATGQFGLYMLGGFLFLPLAAEAEVAAIGLAALESSEVTAGAVESVGLASDGAALDWAGAVKAGAGVAARKGPSQQVGSFLLRHSIGKLEGTAIINVSLGLDQKLATGYKILEDLKENQRRAINILVALERDPNFKKSEGATKLAYLQIQKIKDQEEDIRGLESSFIWDAVGFGALGVPKVASVGSKGLSKLAKSEALQRLFKCVLQRQSPCSSASGAALMP